MSKTVEERLMDGKRVDSTSGCWLWAYGRTGHGYGEITLVPGDKPVYVHRISLQVFRGVHPGKNQMVLHRCDVKACFNPDHLYLGSRLDNARDALERGRSPTGERVGTSKLTVFDLKEIFTMRKLGWSQRRLAEKFHISQGHISDILSGKSWKHHGKRFMANISS